MILNWIDECWLIIMDLCAQPSTYGVNVDVISESFYLYPFSSFLIFFGWSHSQLWETKWMVRRINTIQSVIVIEFGSFMDKLDGFSIIEKKDNIKKPLK